MQFDGFSLKNFPGTLGSTSHQQPRTSLRTSASPFCPTPGTHTECSPPRWNVSILLGNPNSYYRRLESLLFWWESLFSSPSGTPSTQAGRFSIYLAHLICSYLPSFATQVGCILCTTWTFLSGKTADSLAGGSWVSVHYSTILWFHVDIPWFRIKPPFLILFDQAIWFAIFDKEMCCNFPAQSTSNENLSSFNWGLFPDGPATVEHTHQNAGTTPDQFVFWSQLLNAQPISSIYPMKIHWCCCFSNGIK